MRCVTVFICALILTGCGQKIRTGYPTDVTPEQIAAQPNKFVGKKVRVSGYLHSMLFLDVDEKDIPVFDFELYPTKESYLTKNSLGLRVQTDTFSAKICDGHYVSIIGIVNANSKFYATLGDVYMISNHANVTPISTTTIPHYNDHYTPL